MESSSNLPLFRVVRFFRSSNTYKLCSTRLSYSRCREVRELLKDVATTAISLAYKSYVQEGLWQPSETTTTYRKDCLRKVHCRWKTINAKDMYILDDVTERLKVSSSLEV